MSRLSNKTTLVRNLRKWQDVDFNGDFRYNKIVELTNFKQGIVKSLRNKKIIVSKVNFQFLTHNIFFFDVECLFCSVRVNKYRYLLGGGVRKNKAQLDLQGFNSKFREKSLVFVKIRGINADVNSKLLRMFYLKNKRMLGVLFTRRYAMFFDVLKASVLFYESKIESSVILNLLGQTFKVLPKNKHAGFFLFVKQMFETLVGPNSSIKGLRLIVSGRIKGKPRSSVYRMMCGTTPLQQLDSRLVFSQLHVYTVYGCFGFKFWANLK